MLIVVVVVSIIVCVFRVAEWRFEHSNNGIRKRRRKKKKKKKRTSPSHHASNHLTIYRYRYKTPPSKKPRT